MNKQSGTIHHSIFEYHRKRKKRFINHIAIYPHTQNILCLTITFGTMLGAYVVFPTLVETIVNVPINKRSATAQLIYLSHFGSNAKNDNFPFFFCCENADVVPVSYRFFDDAFANPIAWNCHFTDRNLRCEFDVIKNIF